MNNKFSTAVRTLLTVMFLFANCIFIKAQNSEHIFILWDVTGSLLPKQSGMKDYNGSLLPTFNNGNGLWMDLKKSIIDCIEYVDEDPENKISIVTFHGAIRDVFTRNADEDGKQELIDIVKGYEYQTNKYTNIVSPVQRFYNSLTGSDIYYMFLFTDGKNNHPDTKDQLISVLDSWTSKTSSHKAYGFYVLVHPDADNQDIRQSVEKQSNFWIVPDAKVRVKICTLPTSVKYNSRDEKCPKQISIKGNYRGAKGNIVFKSDDSFYNVSCVDSAISNGKLAIKLTPKPGVSIPQQHKIVIEPQIENADKYTFIGPEQIVMEVSNLPQRTLDINIDNKDFGKATYHDSFLFSREAKTKASSDIEVTFSDQAKKEQSSAIMKVYLVDKKGNKITSSSRHIKFHINGKEIQNDGTYELTPDMKKITLSVEGDSITESSKYYGRIELVPNCLEDCTINGVPEIYKWQFKFEKKWNPLKVVLTWLLVIIISGILLWQIVLKRIFFPQFRAINKMMIIPNQAPISLRFKGKRMIVIDNKRYKQSLWNRFWTGEVQYIRNPFITTTITLKPVRRGRQIMFISKATNYMCTPNPIGMQPSRLNDIINNVAIIIQ